MGNIFDANASPYLPDVKTPDQKPAGGNVFDTPDKPSSNNVFDSAPGTPGLTPPAQLKPTTTGMAEDAALEDARRVGELGAKATDAQGINTAANVGEAVVNFPWRKYMVEHAVQRKGMGQFLTEQGYKPRDVWSSPADVPGNARGEAPPSTGDLQDHMRTPLDIPVPGMEGTTGRQMVNYALDSTVGRSVRFMQRNGGSWLAQNMLNATSDAAKDVNESLGLQPDTPADDHLSRTMMEVLGGEKIILPEEKQQAARDELKRKYGQTGAQMLEGSAHLVGTWPVMFFPGGGVFGDIGADVAAGDAAAVAAAKGAAANVGPKALKAILPEAAAAAVTGEIKHQAVTGAYQSLILAGTRKGEDYADAMGLGLELGGFMGMAGGMWNRYRLPKLLSQSLNKLGGSEVSKATPAWLDALRSSTKEVSGKGVGNYEQRIPGLGERQVAPPAAIVPASTMKQLGEQLDQAIASAETGRASPKIRRGPASKYRAGNVSNQSTIGQEVTDAPQTRANNALEYDKTKFSNTEPHDMRFEIEPGEVKKPTFTRFTYNSKGEFVHQAVEVTAGPGGKGTPTNVAMPGSSKPATTYHSTTLTVRVRETPIKKASDVVDLVGQPGQNFSLAAMSDEAVGMMNHLMDLESTRSGTKSADVVAGTPNYMGPEQAAPYTMGKLNTEVAGHTPSGIALVRDASGRLMDSPWMTVTPKERASARRAVLEHEASHGPVRPARVESTGPDKTPIAAVLTVAEDGHADLTPLAHGEVRPHDTQARPGDSVLIDGTVPGVVASQAEDGILTVHTPASKVPVGVKPARAVVNYEDLWSRYHQHPLAEDRPPLVSASPDGGQGMERRVKTIIEAGKMVTVADVLRIAKRPVKDVGWAVGVLKNMEANGKVQQVAPGVWETTRPPIAKFNPIGQEGEFVYYGVGGPSGMGQTGILRGPDSRTSGNYIVEVPNRKAGLVQHNIGGNVWKKTDFISVPGKDLASMKPQGVADPKRVSPSIDMYGWTKPMPDQWVQAASGAFDDITTMSRYWTKAAPPSASGWTRQKWQAFKEAFGGAMHTANEDLRLSAAQKLYSAPHVMHSEALGYTNYLDSKLGAGSAANRALVKVLEAARSRTPSGVKLNQQELQQWITQYPKAAQAALTDITAMVKQLDEQSATLAKYGVGNIDQLEHLRANSPSQHVDEYLTRNYAAWQMPRRDWAEFARKNMTREWSNVIEWMTDVKPGDASQYVGMLDEIMRMDDPLRGFQDKGFIKAESKGKLLAKQDVPEPIRAILGEHKDASTRLAFTLAYQRQLIKSVEGFNAIASHGSLWSPGYRPDMTLKVPEGNPLFGNASGGYVHDGPAMRRLLEGRANGVMGDSNAFLRAAGWLGQRWKAAHTVYNQVAWVNNALRNIKGVMISGGFSSPADMQGFRDAANMLRDYHSDPTVYGRNKLLAEAMDFDAVGPGLAGSELGLAQRKFQRRIFDTFSNGSHNGFTNVLGDIREFAQAVPEAVHGGYDSIDKVAKFGSYLNIRRSLIAGGMSADDAAAVAALRINQSFPNFTQTPDWLRRTVGAGNFSLAAPFATSKLEDVRINATLLARLAKTLNPMSAAHEREWDLVARVMGFSALVGGAVSIATNTRRTNGISDEDDARQRAQLPLRGQNYHPLLLGSLDYDEHHRRVFYPLDQMEDLATMFRGNLQEQDPILMNVLMNNIDDLMGPGSFMGQSANSVAASTGLYHPQSNMMLQMPRADQVGPISLAGKAITPFLPQGPMAAYDAFKATRPSGKLINDEPFTPDQAMVRALGGPKPMIAGPQAVAQSNMENVRGLQGAERDIKSAAREAALQGVSRERMKFMVEQNVRELQKRVREVPRPIKKSNEGPGGSK